MFSELNFAPLGVIAYGIALSVFAEFLQYLWVYRTDSFRKLKQNLEKRAAKVEKAGTAATAATSKGVKKREARLEEWEVVAGKQLSALQFKTGIVAMATMILSLRIVPKIFGDQPVGRLPFEPPAFMQKATHRGVTGADPRDCSALFLFMLCQACIKPLVSKVLGWGPTRRMLDSQVKALPKALKQS